MHYTYMYNTVRSNRTQLLPLVYYNVVHIDDEGWMISQHCAHTLLLSFSLKCRTSSRLKNIPHSFIGLCRALKVSICTNFLRHGSPFFSFNWFLLCFWKLSPCSVIITQIFLVAYKDDGYRGTKVSDLWRPFLWNIFKRIWTINGETHKNDVSVWVWEWSQTIIVLLTWGRDNE